MQNFSFDIFICFKTLSVHNFLFQSQAEIEEFWNKFEQDSENVNDDNHSENNVQQNGVNDQFTTRTQVTNGNVSSRETTDYATFKYLFYKFFQPQITRSIYYSD